MIGCTVEVSKIVPLDYSRPFCKISIKLFYRFRVTFKVTYIKNWNVRRSLQNHIRWLCGVMLHGIKSYNFQTKLFY